MGNLCSKSANEPDAFQQPGRVLGASSEPRSSSTSAPPPKISSSTPARGVEGRDNVAGSDDARGAAARAAEVRDVG